jgi:hypothetical protein
LRRATLLFVALFLFAVVTQLGVGWFRRREGARADLRRAVSDICKELRYDSHWDLSRLRQADLTYNYYIVDASGLAIDIEGFTPDLTFRADLTNLSAGIHTITVPVTNETWRLVVAPVEGGTVTIGVSPPEDITRVDERLEQNAKLFGTTLESATRVRPSDVDRNLDYAVLDIHRGLRGVVGGVPLTLTEYPHPRVGEVEEVAGRGTITYGLLSVPFVSASGKTVGTVTAFEEIAAQPWYSLSAWLVNLFSSLALALVGTLVGVRYIPYEFRPEELLCNALQKGESETTEFKESLRWDQWEGLPEQVNDQRKPSERKHIAEGIAVRTIAGFLNSKRGGTLFIGVADDKKVVGLDRDYISLTKPGEDQIGPGKQRDRFQLHLRDLLAAKIGRDISNLCLTTTILDRDGKDVCVVNASSSPTPVYVAVPRGRAFYLRVGAATVELDVEEAVSYCRERWPVPLFNRLGRSRRSS